MSNLINLQNKANKKLKESADAAIKADKAKSDFLAQMSHEIRTLINTVLGMNEMILHESSDTKIREYSANIQSAGKTLLSLINSILDFSKIEDKKMEIIPAEYDTAVMINDLAASVSQTSEKLFKVTAAAKVVNQLRNTSVINSNIVQIGDKVRVSASANGGTAPYTYAYYYKRTTNTRWNKLGTEFGTNSSVAFAPTAEASYDVKVIVKDSAGNTAEKLFTVDVVTELELTNVSVVGREKVRLGSAIPMIGKAVGGSAPYTYSFYFKRITNTNWKLLGDKFTDKASARFKPVATGAYNIRIDVKDSSGTIEKKYFSATVK